MLLEQDEEKELHSALNEIKPKIKKALKNEEFKEAMSLLSSLRKPIDAFLDNVTVNCGNSDVRKNRLMLLAQMRMLVDEIADFSKIEG